MGEYVNISLEQLYKAKGANLKFGGYIDYTADEDGEYYDVRTDEACGGEVLACDGEQWKVIDEQKDRVLLENTTNGVKLYLSYDEYSIAAFI